MQCKECGDDARDITLRYCENCGAKMPAAPVRGTSSRPALLDDARGGGASRTVTRDASEVPGVRASGMRQAIDHTMPDREPVYDGPAVLARVPGHSPSVLGIGLMVLAVVLSLLLSGVGPFWSPVIVLGGWVVMAREVRNAGQKNGLVDWMPESWMHPAVPALYTVVAVALAIRMLGVGLTPLLWLGGAGLLAYDQYRKVFAGEDGWSRLFEPRQLVRGTALVTLLGVVICLVALFLTWVPGRATPRGAGAGARAPSELRVMDASPPSSDFIYKLLDQPQDAGWDQPGAVFLELLLLGILGMMALRPELEVPGWLRFTPIAVVVLCLVWTLVFGGLMAGSLLFLVGLGVVGFACVFRAFAPQGAEDPVYDEQGYDEQAEGDQTYSDQTQGDQTYSDQAQDEQAYDEQAYDEQAYDEQAEGEQAYDDQGVEEEPGKKNEEAG